MTVYTHKQPGMALVLAFCLAIGLVTLLIVTAARPLHWLHVALLVLLLLCLAVFHALTVEVTRQNVSIRFGLVPLRKRFAVADIAAVDVVKNPWYYGWGIRLTPRGWLFNVAGNDAVELAMRNGKTCRIGTDEPARLKAAIVTAMQA